MIRPEALPLETSTGYAFFLAEKFRDQHKADHQPRLTFLHGVYAHPENYRLLGAQTTLDKLDERILELVRNSASSPSDKTLIELNADILRRAYEETLEQRRNLIAPRDLMVATLLLQPPPIAIVLERTQIQRGAAIDSLRRAHPFRSSAGLSQYPEPGTF